jgi:hypothetical protein
MKTLALSLIFGLFLAGSAIAQSEPGLYLDNVKMDRAQFAGMASKGIAKSVFVPGAGFSIVWDFTGSEAKTRAGASPKFIYQLRANQATRDFVLVRMDQKSDHREIRVSKESGWTGDARNGFDPKKLVELRVTKTGNGFEITPAESLPPGEYFLTAGFSPVGYDFSVLPR